MLTATGRVKAAVGEIVVGPVMPFAAFAQSGDLS